MATLAILGTLSTVVIAWQLSLLVTTVFVERKSFTAVVTSMLLIALFGSIKAAVIWAQELISARAATKVKIELRSKLFNAVSKLGTNWLNQNSIAEINLLANSGLNALDTYFSKYLPQLVYTALVTPALVVLVWSQDMLSGATLALTLPLIPLFMVLIGLATRSAQQKQLDVLTKLTRHFLEVLRGLPTLRIFSRTESQVRTIANVSEQHRVRTMKVLRITFLSGFSLELISSLSVALIAVSIGLRLVNGDISLLVGLFVLLLAPEVYLPIRQVGAHFHAASEGVASSKRVLDIIDLAHAEKTDKELERRSDINFEPGKLTVIVGPSGAGKTTIFRQMLGLGDSKSEIKHEHVAWMPQEPSLFSSTIRDNIVGFESVNDSALQQAIKLAAIDDLRLDDYVGLGGSRISGGQAQRVALARTFYRAICKNTQTILLDEPISALDEHRSRIVIESIKYFARKGKTVVAITHQDQLIKAADCVYEVKNA